MSSKREKFSYGVFANPSPKKKAKRRIRTAEEPKARLTMFRPQVRSRHSSHKEFRKQLGRVPFKSVIRLGSTTVLHDTIDRGGDRIVCNSVEGVKNSADKLKMKLAFVGAGVPTAQCWVYHEGRFADISKPDGDGPIVYGNLPIPIPCVTKHRMGSRGRGNSLIRTQEALNAWMESHRGSLENYIIEKFHDFNREYRLHVTEDGCFYTCRKVIKEGTPENDRWRRHEDNCAWLVETNPKFDKPTNWAAIEMSCVVALKKLGLDVAAFDVKVQTARSAKGTVREAPKYILLESNSAPSFGEGTLAKYLETIPRLLRKKFANQ